jgi:hypothetical protein
MIESTTEQVRPSGQDYQEHSPVLSLTVAEFRQLVAQSARSEEEPDAELALRWEGGELLLKPGTPGTQEKALPLETFFHKIVMVRDRLRVLEQKINSHPKLSDTEKIEMQQYITRIYGSLTSFNLLFRHRDDQFKGAGRKD